MRRYLALTAVLFASLLSGRTVQAQQPCPEAPYVATSLQPYPCPCPPPPPPAAVPCCPPAGPCNREALFAAELIFGQETGFRGQFALYRDHYEAFVVEGFYGELFHDLGSSQALGAGGRYLWRNNWPGCIDAIDVGPGVDVFFQLNSNGVILLTPSVDVAWLHNLGGQVEWEFGLDAGLGIGVAGHTKQGHSAEGDVIPLISFYTGLRF